MAETAQAVGHIASGLFIVSVRDKKSNLIDGYLASFVNQVSFSPLLISLAIKPGRPAYELIKAGEVFGLTIVGEEDRSFLKHFWKGYDPQNNPFNEISFKVGEFGGILLSQGKSALECRFQSSIKPGDHEVFFCEVLSSTIFNESTKPVIHLRKSGLDY